MDGPSRWVRRLELVFLRKIVECVGDLEGSSECSFRYTMVCDVDKADFLAGCDKLCGCFQSILGATIGKVGEVDKWEARRDVGGFDCVR
jgi:hypothetical protein